MSCSKPLGVQCSYYWFKLKLLFIIHFNIEFILIFSLKGMIGPPDSNPTNIVGCGGNESGIGGVLVSPNYPGLFDAVIFKLIDSNSKL